MFQNGTGNKIETEMNPHGTPENMSKPGMTNNPNGRPKGSGVRQWLKKISEEIDEETGKTKGHVLAETLWQMAKGKNSKAIDMVIDNIDGKVLQRLQVEPLDVTVKYNDDTES